MAQLTATQRTEAIIRAGEQFTAFEGRFSNYGVFKAFRDQANLLFPEQAQLERQKSQQNAVPVYFPVLNKQTASLITARSCTITGSNPVSARVTITSIVRGFEFTVYPKVSDNNLISEEQQYADGIVRGLRAVLPAMDTYAASILETNKSAVNATVALPGITASSTGYVMDNDKRDKLYYYVPTILARNDVGGGFSNIANTEARELMLEYETKSTNNVENMRGVLEGDLPDAVGMRHYTSNRLPLGTGMDETHYLVQNGSIGVFTWNDSDAVNNRTSDNARAYLQADPITGIRWDVLEKDICSDLTGIYGAGFERTFGTLYQFAVNLAFMTAYSSDTSKPIYKLELASAA